MSVFIRCVVSVFIGASGCAGIILSALRSILSGLLFLPQAASDKATTAAIIIFFIIPVLAGDYCFVVSGLFIVVSGCAVFVVVSELLGSAVGAGVSQAAIASTDEMPRIINNFFIDVACRSA